MDTIIVRDSEEPGVWGSACGDGKAGGYRRWRRVSAIFLTSAFLATIELAGAVNVPAVAAAANQNNPIGNPVNNGAAEAPRHWAADTTNGCKVWSSGEIASDITARWSGRCENNFAQGPGTVRWLSNNKQVAELTGNMEQGKIRGHTTGVEEPGNRIDGMFIDSLPEGEGKASFVDGSVYNGMWHRGRQLGYGIMTFPPAHPQYQEMLNEGRGRRTENGTYELRGWWEGKNFVTPCDSEDECEKKLVAQIKREQEAAAAKAGTPVAPAPAATVTPAVEPVTATPAIPATEPVVTAPVTPAVEPVTAMPAIPAAEPAVTAPAIPDVGPVTATPAIPATEPAVAAPATPVVEPVADTPKTELPAMEPVPSALPVPANPVIEPAPAATAPIPELPAVAPSISAPATPAAEPASEPAAVPDDKPAVVPEAAPVT
ncbi:hypothetical protein [Collimonas sp. OK307]|uniref:hypothetical protein n=1 Tax=Collimonas sp. OK307 TaxID=1801620 RepID=UPI000ABF66A2|nr:hypothetical protein [Collimonas sp. OK307]